MKTFKSIFTAFMSGALFVIAMTVTVGLMNHKDMWKAIVIYWIALSFKNLVDYMVSMID